jgi:hypothetical protein
LHPYYRGRGPDPYRLARSSLKAGRAPRFEDLAEAEQGLRGARARRAYLQLEHVGDLLG